MQDQQSNDEEEEAEEEQQAVIQDSSAQPAAASQVRRDGVLKTQTALQLFRKDWLGAERTAGRCWNPCNLATWPACRAAFQALQPAVRATYEMQAAVTCVRAKSRREAGRTPLPQPRAVGHRGDEQPGDEQQAEPGGEKQAAPSMQAWQITPLAPRVQLRPRHRARRREWRRCRLRPAVDPGDVAEFLRSFGCAGYGSKVARFQ